MSRCPGVPRLAEWIQPLFFPVSSLAMLPVPSPDVVFKQLPDGAVLYHPAQEVYYGLNTVGAETWELLPPACSTVDEICDQLAGRYPDADRGQICADVRELLDDLLRNDLLTVDAALSSAEQNHSPAA